MAGPRSGTATQQNRKTENYGTATAGLQQRYGRSGTATAAPQERSVLAVNAVRQDDVPLLPSCGTVVAAPWLGTLALSLLHFAVTAVAVPPLPYLQYRFGRAAVAEPLLHHRCCSTVVASSSTRCALRTA